MFARTENTSTCGLRLTVKPEGVRVSGSASHVMGEEPVPGGERSARPFATWSWDGTTLHIATSRHGLHPLFLRVFADGIGLSASIDRTVLGDDPGPLNLAALAVFLRVGYFLGDDTAWRDIHRVGAGVSLTWSAAEGLVERSRRHELQRELRLGRAEARRRFDELLVESVRDCLDENEVTLPLSGGRDSRHILLAMHKLGRLPARCVTVEFPAPRDPAWDVESARQLAAHVGAPHEVVRSSPDYFSDCLQKNERTAFCADEHGWALPLVRRLERQSGVILDGLGGDILSAGNFTNERRITWFEQGHLGDLARDLIDVNETCLLRALGKEWRAALSKDLAIAHLEQALSKHRDAPSPMASFIFWNRARRELALLPYSLYSHALKVRAPFLSDDLFDFLLSLPIRTFVDQQFHDITIADAYPGARGIPYDNDIKRQRPLRPGRTVMRARSARLLTHLRHTSVDTLIDRPFVASRLLVSALDGRFQRLGIGFERLTWLSQFRPSGQGAAMLRSAQHA
jgi:asparagine synthase (glutamine-hydrolysing)